MTLGALSCPPAVVASRRCGWSEDSVDLAHRPATVGEEYHPWCRFGRGFCYCVGCIDSVGLLRTAGYPTSINIVGLMSRAGNLPDRAPADLI